MGASFSNPPTTKHKRPVTRLYERRAVSGNHEVWTQCWITFYEYGYAFVMPLEDSDKLTAENENLPCMYTDAQESIINSNDFRQLECDDFVPPRPTMKTNKDQRVVQL